MYAFLTRYVSKGTARWLCVCWYLALLLGVVLLSVEPPADFRYGRY